MRHLSHIASLAAPADATYSASVDDWDMLDCSQDDHEMGPPVSRKQPPIQSGKCLGP